MTKYNFRSYSKISEGSSESNLRFDWCVFLDEKQAVLDSIEYVKYILHPSFPNPERIIEDSANKFALYSNGWGNFEILIEIRKKDGTIITTRFYLQLKEDNWPVKAIENMNVDENQEKVYQTLKDSKFQWRKLSTVMEKTNLPNDVVLATIRELEKNNLIRKAHFKSASDSQELFGVTTRVGIRPE